MVIRDELHTAYARYFQDVLGCRIVPLWGIREPVVPGGIRTCRCQLGPECENPGKHATRSWKDTPSLLPNKLQNWGYVSDTIVVIDCDTHEAELPWTLPPTWEIGTSKGRHLLFRWNGGMPLATRIRVVPDVDLKAHGGLVVGPGSRRVDGGIYEPINENPIADLPEEVVAATKVWTPPTKLVGVTLNERTSSFAMDTVERLCGEMQNLGKGSRNQTLFNGLCWLFRSGWAGQDAINRYKEAAMDSGLTEEEVERSYVSAWRSVFG